MKCTVCAHKKRKQIEKEIMRGIPHTKIAKNHNLNNQAIRYHSVNHLPRQLMKNEETKNLLHGKDLLQNVNELINRTKSILDGAENKKLPFVRLSAIRELRQIYEFLIKFSVHMLEAKKADDLSEREIQIRDLKRLDVHELKLLNNLVAKVNGEIDTDILRGVKDEMRLELRMCHSKFDYDGLLEQPLREPVYRRKHKKV
ncbi:MAG: hypothetical protein GY797_34665 [Deltaproteobacteria bacterium]|nr:hypothetical protein [Deltaproteobacteria bacterium]